MRPLIPSVRPGDILRGTRNLRHYLQTASTLNYVNDLSHEMMSRKRGKQNLYRPSKDERFLVAVNAWAMFGVCSLDTDVVLLFANARQDQVPRSLAHKIPKRMDPTIFSKWFIRTPAKMTHVDEWPDHAHLMWAGLHLNLSGIRHDSAPGFHYTQGSMGPFAMKHNSRYGHTRDQLNTLMLQWFPKGITRPGTTSTGRGLPSGGCGPQLEEITAMRQEIQRICANPRIAQRLKKDADYVYKAFLQNQ